MPFNTGTLNYTHILPSQTQTHSLPYPNVLPHPSYFLMPSLCDLLTFSPQTPAGYTVVNVPACHLNLSLVGHSHVSHSTPWSQGAARPHRIPDFPPFTLVTKVSCSSSLLLPPTTHLLLEWKIVNVVFRRRCHYQ